MDCEKIINIECERFMMTYEGKISFLQIFTEKGKPGEKHDIIYLEEGKGISGDRHADGGDRQISILLTEVREWMKEQEEPGLCFRRYKENIRIAGVKPERLQEGTRLQIGTCELEITGFGKRCFPECRYVSAGKDCVLLHGAFYARVVRSGRIEVNDRVICMQKNA